MATQVTRKPSTYGNRMFDQGVLSGISWFHQGDTPNVPPSVAMIVEFIKDNMIELAQEVFLEDERLANNAGFLVGWILGDKYIMTATPRTTTQAFRRGISWGRKGIFRGNVCGEQSEEDIVEITQNLIDFALEGNLTEDLLRHDVQNCCWINT